MADVDKRVDTRFTVNTAGAMGALGTLSSAFSGVGGIISRVTSVINPLTIALSAAGGALSAQKVLSVGSAFEDMQIGMAQTLRFMGQGGETWQDAMANSEMVMQRIRAAAAALPGEAEDYQMALQLAGTNANRATGDFDRSFSLIKNMTAVSLSMGGNAQLAAVEMNRMLNTNQGMMENTSDFSMRVLNAMQQLPGQANLTTAEFNKMDLKKRLSMLEGMVGQFDDMVDASSNTWGAVSGAASSAFELIFQKASAPLFDGMKTGVKSFTDLLVDADGNLAPLGAKMVDIGAAISNGIVAAMEQAVSWAGKLYDVFDDIASSGFFDPILAAFDMIKNGIGALQGTETKQGQAGAVGAGVGLAGGVAAGVGLGPLLAVVGPLSAGLAVFATNTDAVGSTMQSLSDLLSSTMVVVDPLIAAFGTVGEVVGGALVPILPALAGALNQMYVPIFSMIGGILTIGSTLYQALLPALNTMWSSIGKLIEALGNLFGPVYRIVRAAFLGLYSVLATVLEPVISVVAYALSGLADVLSPLINWIASKLDIFATNVENATGQAYDQRSAKEDERTQPIEDWLAASQGFVADMVGIPKELNKTFKPGAAAVGGGAAAPTARGGGGRAVQDFRFSTFQIQQKFEEGFDPDRIAVAFASDLERVGQEKLQSGFEPLFAIN